MPANDSSAKLMKNDKSKSWRMNPKQSNNDVKLRIWTAKKDNMYYRSGENIIIYLIAETPYSKERIQAIVSPSPWGDELKSVDIIEKSHDYKKKINHILSEDKHTDIAEYALDIWSIP